ncbi:MAG: hypothetical protein K5928_02895 [Prevotella sp.]|nr:hypothetical protein [Prevotella sp.]
MKKYIPSIYMIPLAWLCLTACQDTEDTLNGAAGAAVGTDIRVGGVSTDQLVAHAAVTRADGDEAEEVQRDDAENIPWLRGPLKNGLAITYGKTIDGVKRSKVAILTLLTNVDGSIKYAEDDEFDGGQAAEYSFFYKYKDRGNSDEAEATPSVTAQWFDNGAHFFEGLHVPDRIVTGATGFPTDLTTDQHGDGDGESDGGTFSEADMGNYTLLSHYLSMPSNYTINATVKRIKLPFRHRLARVLAYILIDPTMVHSDKTRVKIAGYMKDKDGNATAKEDPSTSEIKFCNVKVLDYVANNGNQDQPYQPRWTKVRKAIPHFVGERGSYDDSKNQYPNDAVKNDFIAYYSVADKTYIYPTDKDWATAHGKIYDPTTNLSSDGKYERTSYGTVPVYDLIVRPTYTTLGRVMYDEDTSTKSRQDYMDEENQIEFEITLDNGLKYSKVFNFDLDANYQTVVYLHISHERVDYDNSGSELWVETTGYDDWYGVNNQNGNNLSFAGSGWQRAYTCGKTFTDRVTDGHYYYQDGEDLYAQYVDDATWIEMFREAYKGGNHHGDYFILEHDISIPAAALPDGFVFTGHLDGLDHTITLTDGTYTPAYDSYETPYGNAADTKYVRSGDTWTEFTPAAGVTYYQKTNDGTADVYTAIADMKSYAGAVAYTKETVTTYTYTLATVAAVKAAAAADGATYYRKDGESYTAISNIEYYISDVIATIYTKNGEDEYSSVTSVADLDDSETYYTHENETYSPIANLAAYIGIYTRSSDETDVYTPIVFYKKVHHKGVSGAGSASSGAHLFSGLNGHYTTAQEGDAYTGTWEANVHKESGKWVPYKSATDGWRAEIINTNIEGGTVFPATAVYGTDITGYVHNCWEGATYDGVTNRWSGGNKVTEYTPSLPEY